MKEIQKNFFKLAYKLYGCIWLNKIVTFKKILTLHSVQVASSPNLPPIFFIAFWGETNRSSISQMFFKIGALKNFANFIGKHQCKSIFLINLQSLNTCNVVKETPTQVFSCEICEVFKNTCFYRTPPVAASEQTQDIPVVHCVAKWCSGHLAQVF